MAAADPNLATVSDAATSNTFPISPPIRTKSETETGHGLDTNAREPASLLTLPPEPRMKIYQFLIVPDGPVSIWEERTPFRVSNPMAPQRWDDIRANRPAPRMRGGRYVGTTSAPLLRPYFSKKHDASILRVSKVLHCEATSVLYAKLEFTFSSSGALSLFLTNIGPQNRACLITICLETDMLNQYIEETASWLNTLVTSPKLAKLVVCVDVICLEYLDRKVKGSRYEDYGLLWYTSNWISTSNACIENLRRIATQLITQGANEAEKRKKLAILELKSVSEQEDDTLELKRLPTEPLKLPNGVSIEQRFYGDVLAGLRDDIEKLLVLEGSLAASSDTFNTDLVWLRPVWSRRVP